MKADSRTPYWDNLRFFLMLLVVVGHFAEAFISEAEIFKSIFIFIYAFHMPLFLFVSGMFHKNNDISVRVIQYLSYYIITKIILALANLIINGIPISFSLFSEYGIPWFMFALAVFTGVTYLMRKINVIYLVIIFTVLACFAGYDSSLGDYLVISRMLVYYPFYLTGVAVSRGWIEKMVSIRLLKAVGCIGILAFATICIFNVNTIYILRPLFTGRNPFSVLNDLSSYGCLYRLLCYTITVLVSAFVMMVVPASHIPVISTFGKRTIQVYTWHYVVYYILINTGIAGSLVHIRTFGKPSWILCAIATTLILSLKVFQYPSKWVFNKNLLKREF